MVTATTHLRMGPKQLHIYATAGTYRRTINGRTMFLNINSNLLIQISEMNRYVLVLLMLKLTQHARVKLGIIGDIMMAVHGLMQERVSL